MLLALLLAAAPLTTVAEASGWTRTGRYDEVEALCAAFPRRYPGRVRCEAFGVSPLGRPLYALVAGPRAGRPVVLLQGGIHAGEIDGKDAGLWLLRELLEGRAAPGALEALTLVFVPVFNADGHERFGPNQRPNQRGPVETGWRVTAQNLNLNRDYLKADAPEMQAMLRLLHRWKPILYVDLHVTDGAKFQHDVSVTFEPQRLGPRALQAHGRALREALFPRLEAQGHRPVGFYPAFDVDDDPASGFSAGWPPPRFAHAYWALNRRFGVLVETHSWKDSATRVKATFDVCAGLLEEAARHAGQWQAAALAADAEAATRAGAEVTLMHQPTAAERPIDFLGYAYTRTPSEVSGKPWVQYDEARPEVWRVPLREVLAPALTVRAPRAGYLVPPPHAEWVRARLALHDVRVEVLPRAVPAHPVEVMRVEPTFRPSPYEGRLTAIVKGAWTPATEALPRGTLFVPIAQPQAELVMHLLEPTAPDSFTSWGFFNAHLEQKEYLEDYLTEAWARERLQEPAVKAAFEAKLKDPAFARDPARRLEFFSRTHPSFDARLNLVPVYRADERPR